MRPFTQNLLTVAGLSLAIAVTTNVLTALPANPIVYTERPPLMQVDAKGVARELLTTKQYRCFSQLMGKESAWNPKAKNPTSTAQGVGQLLDDTYKNLGMKHSKAEVPQVVAALAYIGRKYGSAGPCGAWRHWQKNNWY
jgi:hypothetical protein